VVLRLSLDPDRARSTIPTLRLLTRSQKEIGETARRLQPAMQAWCGGAATVEVADCASQVGSGSLPVDRLPSAALRIRCTQARGARSGLDRLARALRALPVPVVGRIHEDALWLDLRCVDDPVDEALLSEQLRKSPL
jgi:L-seryl-tRNA(Ser) seleniumtransferase